MTTEDGVLTLIEETCRGRAPLFTQQHEVIELEAESKFAFRAAPDGPTDWPAGVPRPLIVMNWATLAMRRACEEVIVSQEVEIAEMVYLGLNSPAESRIKVEQVVDEVCNELTTFSRTFGC